MSSTKEEKLAAFWRELLAPAAEQLRSRDAQLLDMDKSGSSWSKPPESPAVLSELAVSELGEQLQARLETEGFKELADLIPELMKLAAELRPSEGVDEDVDPFVYVMH